ncbi:MAG: [FeFe] hydrogenase H-cluster maturation GTPase HydF [Finegoldia magna]|uniref:[FeFe] hydrogenase H-cluster maturation GTPase HydF n=1 Tax=Finegoldia magna TaxID=1260 RepID=UPI000B9157BC|nr:[FeFe] hydrogenase H-cluster maturation GTPase HydF [Finegoldia magna]MDU1010051.1 [FeFe] hydrogenase H-cluster maturation GTPase HydF [Finegoldia magna]MDU1088004.1 [FeFe] hydrogenase H-cluster maturation GTPase HydF [Finegoldia magna]OXZ37849.1 [FeFe] hydrogenase H-cluster maturation GTPase HydF [Finegoldia magna]
MATEISDSNAHKSMKNRIVIVGDTNVGKSTLINKICKQNVSITSNIKGTTTDTVKKTIEIEGVGACTIVDTAGLNDDTFLGEDRKSKTLNEIKSADLIIYVTDDVNKTDIGVEINENVKIIKLFNDKSSTMKNSDNTEILSVNALTGENVDLLLKKISENLIPKSSSITDGLVDYNDKVLLVMPQDKSSPTGRLILPQSQIMKELLDKECLVLSTGLETLEQSLQIIPSPDLVITDSKVFKEVDKILDKKIKLTSFSILFAKNKGDLNYFIQSVSVLDNLLDDMKILITEACTHSPKEEDIGRVKIPSLIRKINPNVTIDFARGEDFFNVACNYDLIIHCGGCMQNKMYMQSKTDFAKSHQIPMTNYGIVLAKMNKILDRVTY